MLGLQESYLELNIVLEYVITTLHIGYTQWASTTKHVEANNFHVPLTVATLILNN